MDTKEIKNAKAADGKGKSNKGKAGVAAGVAAAAGAMAGYAAAEVVDFDLSVEEPVVEEVVEVIPEESETQTAQTEVTVESVAPLEPQPMTDSEETLIAEAEPMSGEPDGGEELSMSTEFAEVYEDAIESAMLDNADVDLIADNIIMGSEIDPEDINAPDMFDVQEVGTVYTVDGGSLMAAAVHSETGGDMYMVDIDNDGCFDVVTDLNGDFLAEVQGHINVSDAELMASASSGYLAPNDYDIPTSLGESALQDEIIPDLA